MSNFNHGWPPDMWASSISRRAMNNPDQTLEPVAMQVDAISDSNIFEHAL
jgi:hypothetical protein